MVAFSDISKFFDSVEKWRKLAALPDEMAELRTKIAELERKLSHRDPLACAECGHIPVRIETKQWQSSFGTNVQTIRRICPDCGRIDGRDVQIGQG